MTIKKSLDLRKNDLWNDGHSNIGEGVDDLTAPSIKRKLILSWKQLNVTVSEKIPKYFGRSRVVLKRILNDVSGYVECGTLLGIMGPSGSGKTTLLATISHRTKGNFQGKILLNGRPISEDVMIKISGFVSQEDISFIQLTVSELLILMARLKMDRSTTKKAIRERIDGVVAELDLGETLDTQLCHLSGGERKKLSLAVQLINDPPIVFCDEITTGLDSFSAARVIDTLVRLARGRAKIVVCTVHQPASALLDRFQQVMLLTADGQLAYQGSVTSMVDDVFQRYNYICPSTYNKADFVISILNSVDEFDKINVKNMCKLSSIVTQMDFKLHESSFEEKDIQLKYIHQLQIQRLDWITQILLLLSRSTLCFIRDSKEKLLEIGMLMLFGIIISTPFANLKFDKNAVQNWQGFWFCWIINTVFQYSYYAISIHHVNFSVVHREISNNVYTLSAYFVSEMMLYAVWLMIKTVPYCILVFWIVGVDWFFTELLVFVIIAFAAFSYGSLLSACFNSIEEALACSLVYEFLAYSISGAYASTNSLPTVLFYLRYVSLYFLGCESMSCLFWGEIKSLPCSDVDNCLNDGQSVLNKYGFKSDDLNFDIKILLAFCVIANIISYFGLLNRIKKQSVY